MKYPEHILVKFPAGTKARLKSRGGSMQEFIRGAVEAALSGGSGSSSVASDRVVSRIGSARKISRKNLKSESELSANGRVLLTAIRKRGIYYRREAMKDFGWSEADLLKVALELRGVVESDPVSFWIADAA